MVDSSADYADYNWTTKHPRDAQGLAGVQASKWEMAQTFNFDLCHVSCSLDRNPASVLSICGPTHLVKGTDETDGRRDSPPRGNTVRPGVGADLSARFTSTRNTDGVPARPRCDAKVNEYNRLLAPVDINFPVCPSSVHDRNLCLS